MKGYIIDIAEASKENKYFRKVLYTANNMQLVIMSLKPKEEIGHEKHRLDQFIRIEKGKGKAIINKIEYALIEGMAVIIPAGTPHNVINTSKIKPLKLYTLYSPPAHRDGVIHRTKSQADADDEEFDGKTTE